MALRLSEVDFRFTTGFRDCLKALSFSPEPQFGARAQLCVVYGFELRDLAPIPKIIKTVAGSLLRLGTWLKSGVNESRQVRTDGSSSDTAY